MREIKFRAKAGTQWRYGDLYHNECGELVIYEPKTSGRTLGGGAVDGWRIKVAPETVGQFTGIHDANGHEIYEGDVLEYKTWAETGEHYVTMGEVRYVQDQFLVVGPKDIEVQGLFGVAHEPALSDVLVVGNIHDNPELLERKP